MTAREQALREAQERAAFERAVQCCTSPEVNARNIRRHPDGYYIEDRIDALWDGWQMHARATPEPPAPAQDSERLRKALTGLLAVAEIIAANRKGELMSNVETRHGSFVNIIDPILAARAALATSAPRTAIEWPEKLNEHCKADFDKGRAMGWNDAIATCRAAVAAAAEGETK